MNELLHIQIYNLALLFALSRLDLYLLILGLNMFSYSVAYIVINKNGNHGSCTK